MKITFENTGPIEKGEVELGKLTVLCGKNNTGKTYVSYIIYSILKRMKQITFNEIRKYIQLEETDRGWKFAFDELYSELNEIKEKVNERLVKDIPYIFNANKATFVHSKFKLEDAFISDSKENIYHELKAGLEVLGSLEKIEVFYDEKYEIYFQFTEAQEANYHIIYKMISVALVVKLLKDDISSVFLLPAERCGINMFYKELNVHRNTMLYEMMGRGKKEIEKLSKYPLPISDYIVFLNELEESNGNDGESSDIVKELEGNIIGGSYNITKNGEINFRYHKDDAEKEDIMLNFHMASSTAKSLFGLDCYLKNLDEREGYLIIDEPEQNLHPDNQRKIARLLARIVNGGINVMISTHSDYIVKEINNLIQLGQEFNGRKEIMERYGYSGDELLKKEDVKGYFLNKHEIQPMEMEAEGLVVESFDEVINSMNYVSDEIYFTKQENV